MLVYSVISFSGTQKFSEHADVSLNWFPRNGVTNNL